MKIYAVLACGAIPLLLGACSTLPSASTLSDGTVAVFVSTLNEAPLPKPETQRLADQQCSGSARYVATENVTPIKARHIYRCGGGSGAGYSSSSAPAQTGFSDMSGGYSDSGVSSSDLSPM